MGALDELLSNNKPSSAPVSSGTKPLAPAGAASSKPVSAKVQTAQRSLVTQTKKVKAAAKASPRAQGNLDSILHRADQISQGKKDTGWHFSLNPIEDIAQVAQHVPGVQGVLTALDTPASYVRSLVNQTANALDFSDKKGFDLGQLQSDAAAHKGMGEYFQEQLVNQAAHSKDHKAHVFGVTIDPESDSGAAKWFKRAVGLTGDIAADPLTYVGAGLTDAAGNIARGAKSLDRVELARNLAARQAAGEAIKDETIQAVGRKGVTGLTPELQKQLGLRPTLEIGNVPIPGTEKIAAGTRAVTGKLREVAGDTFLGKAARKVAEAPVERGLVENVVQGGTKAVESAKSLDAIKLARGAARQFASNQGAELKDILRSIPKHELPQLAGALESGVTEGAAGRVRSWLDNVLTEANAKGANLGRIEDYYPHALTPKAAEVLSEKGLVPRAAKGGSVGPELLRKYTPGEDFLGTPLVTGNVDEINQVAKAKLGFDIFDPKAERVLPNYLHAVQSAVERGQYATRQIEHGIAKQVKDVPPDYRVINKGATKTVEPEWLAETRTVERALPAAEKRMFLSAWDRFTQLWKAGATFSPGFHVRNAYSGVFNNFVAGVKTSAYDEYARLSRAFTKGTLKEADKPAWDYVQRVVESTGNAFDPAEIGRAGQLTRHKIIGAPGKASRAAGNFVENHLRGTMALDSFKAGEPITSAIDRVERFHFNYADISEFDRMAKRVIPFWMFTSRNLPLQAQMMFRSPNAYTKFLALQRNLQLGVQPDAVVPSYFGEQGAIPTDIGLPGGEGTKYLALDLPFLRLNKDLQMLTDPVRMLSEANPLIKLPVEQIAGKKLYNNVPFTDTPQPLPHGDTPVIGAVLGKLLEGVGLAQEGANGPMITDRALNTLEGLVPVAGRARRLVPDEELYNQRLGTSLASFLGLSSLTNSPSSQAGELARRTRELQAFLKEQQGLGYINKPKQKSTKKPFGKKG